MFHTRFGKRLGRILYCPYLIHIHLRSPLNVVHASIELLKDYLAALSISDAALTDLIDDAYKSSLAAINILSNLLNFENIDAGLIHYITIYLTILKIIILFY